MLNSQDDFHNKSTKQPIEISCTFEIGEDDTNYILASMKDEDPAISNAMSQLIGARSLRATTKYFVHPNPFGILTKIEFNESQTSDQDRFITIYEIPDSLAPQILLRFEEASNSKRDLGIYTTLHKQFDSGDFTRMKEPERAGLPLRYVIDQYVGRQFIPTDVLANLTRLLDQATSFPDFREFLNVKINEIEDSIKVIEKSPIAGSIYTFGGHQHFIPRYVDQLCKRIAELKVLYQSERREPIGQADRAVQRC